MSTSKITKTIVISDEIRTKVLAKDYNLTDKERTELDAVYFMVTSIVGKGRKIAKCPGNSCLEMPYKIVGNYINFHEPQHAKNNSPKRNTKIVNIDGGKNLSQFRLKDLRKMYPEIKATSTEAFIKKVNELENK